MNQESIYCRRRSGYFRLERLPLPMCDLCREITCEVKAAMLAEVDDEQERRPEYRRSKPRVFQDHE